MNPSPGGRIPVMADVARVAGVSHQTVSRVLNGHPNVKTETHARVVAAIEELGYHRNSSARALVTRRSQVIGVVAFDTTLHGPASTVLGIERAAREAGYFVSMVSLRSVTRASIREALDHLTGQAVEGCIVVAPKRSVVQALAGLTGSYPLVAVEGGEAPDLPVVCVDQVTGAYEMTRHLLDLGHRTVHHVAGPRDWLEAEGRVTGWRRALEEAGAPVPEFAHGDWSPRSGFRIGRELARRDDVSAVFVANDQMALGLLRAFGEAGRRVPEDVSVAGFDDVPEAEFFSPPMTTVFQDFGEVGRRSISVLLRLLDPDGVPTGPLREVVPPQLVHRSSTAAPPDC